MSEKSIIFAQKEEHNDWDMKISFKTVWEFLKRYIFAPRKTKEVSIVNNGEKKGRQYYVINKIDDAPKPYRKIEKAVNGNQEPVYIEDRWIPRNMVLGHDYILRRYVIRRYGSTGTYIAKLEKEGRLKAVKVGGKSYYHIKELEDVFGEPFFHG